MRIFTYNTNVYPNFGNIDLHIWTEGALRGLLIHFHHLRIKTWFIMNIMGGAIDDCVEVLTDP